MDVLTFLFSIGHLPCALFDRMHLIFEPIRCRGWINSTLSHFFCRGAVSGTREKVSQENSSNKATGGSVVLKYVRRHLALSMNSPFFPWECVRRVGSGGGAHYVANEIEFGVGSSQATAASVDSKLSSLGGFSPSIPTSPAARGAKGKG